MTAPQTNIGQFRHQSRQMFTLYSINSSIKAGPEPLAIYPHFHKWKARILPAVLHDCLLMEMFHQSSKTNDPQSVNRKEVWRAYITRIPWHTKMSIHGLILSLTAAIYQKFPLFFFQLRVLPKPCRRCQVPNIEFRIQEPYNYGQSPWQITRSFQSACTLKVDTC